MVRGKALGSAAEGRDPQEGGRGAVLGAFGAADAPGVANQTHQLQFLRALWYSPD